jgi:tetratricopeptide (TPR) repeat protein
MTLPSSHRLIFVGLLAIVGPSCLKHPSSTAGIGPWAVRVDGPATTTVDLIHSSKDGRQLFVEVDLGLDRPSFFLVDTGAALSAITGDVAHELGLTPIPQRTLIQGLGGTSTWSATQVPKLRIGAFTIHDVVAAVDLPGLPDSAEGMPVDGIIGNNVWGAFSLTLDFPASEMILARPGHATVPPTAARMYFDGVHCLTDVDLIAGTAEAPVHDPLRLAIDTAGRSVLLAGEAGMPFSSLATEGEEVVRGVGSEDALLASSFTQRTRRVHIASIALGGSVATGPYTAIWLDWNSSHRSTPAGLSGYLGYDVLDKYRIFMDFTGGSIALLPSQGQPRLVEGSQILLDRDRKTFGDDPERGLVRARLLGMLDQPKKAVEVLEPFLARHPDDVDASVLLARLMRYSGNIEGYWTALTHVDAGKLAETGEILEVVGGHLLAGRKERATMLAESAVKMSPGSADAWLALSEVRLASNNASGARQALAEANRIDENPDGHLLWRARVAQAEGDRVAAMSHVRQLLALYPAGGFSLWFYAALATTPEDRASLKVDMEQAMARLHPEDRPLDFQLAAYKTLGDDAQVSQLLSEGLERECPKAKDEAGKANCEAWFLGLAGKDLDHALALSNQAISLDPHRSDFLDTLSLVHRRRGEAQAAAQASAAAAALSPDDIYLLWQNDRVARGDMIP